MKIDAHIRENINNYFNNRAIISSDGAVAGTRAEDAIARQSGASGALSGEAADGGHGVNTAGNTICAGQNKSQELDDYLTRIPSSLREAALALFAYKAPITPDNLEKLISYVQMGERIDIDGAALLVTGEVSAASSDIGLLSDILNGHYDIDREFKAVMDLYAQAMLEDGYDATQCSAAIKAIYEAYIATGAQDALVAIQANNEDSNNQAIISNQEYNAPPDAPALMAEFIKNGSADNLIDAIRIYAFDLYNKNIADTNIANTATSAVTTAAATTATATAATAAVATNAAVAESADIAAGAEVGTGTATEVASFATVDASFATAAEAESVDIAAGAAAGAELDAEAETAVVSFVAVDAATAAAATAADANAATVAASANAPATAIDSAPATASANAPAAAAGSLRDLLYREHGKTLVDIFRDPTTAPDIIKEHYGLLLIQSNLLRASLKMKPQATAAKTAALNRIGELDGALRLINSLNNKHQYVQVPLGAAYHDSNLELFVMKRGGKKKKIDIEDATLFLSLNTINFGRVEALVHVGKNKHISLNMRAEDDDILSLMKNRRIELHDSFHRIGYKLARVTFALIEERITAASAATRAAAIFPDRQSLVDYRI